MFRLPESRVYSAIEALLEVRITVDQEVSDLHKHVCLHNQSSGRQSSGRQSSGRLCGQKRRATSRRAEVCPRADIRVFRVLQGQKISPRRSITEF